MKEKKQKQKEEELRNGFELIDKEDIVFRAPNDGLDPYNFEKVIGRKLNKDLKEDDLITFDDLSD